MSEPLTQRGEQLLLFVLGMVACLPGALPGAEAYIDNGPHLLEVSELARAIWPEDWSWVGWSDRAQAGQVIGQLNAPLPWGALAWLVRLGLPLVPLYLLCGLLSNGVFALGLWRLASAVLPPGRGPLFAALLGACAVQDLYGIAGATGGMWPFRLAHGLLLWGMADHLKRPSLTRSSGWLALVLLCHTFVGVIAFAWAGGCAALHLIRRRRGQAVVSVLSIGLALALTGGFWLPLLEASLRSGLQDPSRWSLARSLSYMHLPLETYALVVHDKSVLLGGVAGLLGGALTGAGLLAVAAHRSTLRPRQPELAGLMLAGLLVLLALLIVIIPLTQWGGLGPNPWRYYAFYRTALALVAGAGLGALLSGAAALKRRRLTLLMAAPLTLSAIAVGLQEIPLRMDETTAALWNGAEQTWAIAAAESSGGRVYVENTSRDPLASPRLQKGHLGALIAVQQPVSTIGSWYGITATPTDRWTTSESVMVMGAPREWVVTEGADWLAGRLALFGVSTIVSHSEPLYRLLSSDDRYEFLGGSPPFAAFRYATPPQPMLGAPPSLATLSDITAERARASATVALTGDSPAPFRLRQSYHPWWSATLNGEAIPLSEGEMNGLIEGVLPRSGALVMEWRDRGRWARWFSLAGAIGWLGAVVWSRRERRESVIKTAP